MNERKKIRKAVKKVIQKELCRKWFFKGLELTYPTSLTKPEWQLFYRAKFEKLWDEIK